MRFLVPQDGDPKDFNTQNVHQFSFFERLEGWKITQRKRNTGRFDVVFFIFSKNKIATFQ